jgi:hypothetical protein
LREVHPPIGSLWWSFGRRAAKKWEREIEVKRTLRRTVVAALLGCAMLVVAAPVASAADFWNESSHDFGNQNVGSTSAPTTFALEATCDAFNPGLPPNACLVPTNGVHNYGAITTTGPFAIDPATDVCNARGGTLLTPFNTQPVDVCTLQVTFKPTSGGVVAGRLSTTTSPTGSPLSVALKGTGISTGTQTGKKCKKKGKKSAASAAKKCKKKGRK